SRAVRCENGMAGSVAGGVGSLPSSCPGGRRLSTRPPPHRARRHAGLRLMRRDRGDNNKVTESTVFESDPGGGFSSPCQFWFGERVPRPNLRLAKEIFMVKESLLRLCKDPNLESAVSIRDPGSTLFILLRSHFRGSGLLELNRNVIQEPFGETDLRRAIDFVTLYQSLS